MNHGQELYCIADELARQGTIMPLLPEKENVGMPKATCKLILKIFFNKLANTHWQNAPQTWPVISSKKTSELLKFSRTECGILVRALTGHWPVGTHVARPKALKNDFCRGCRDEEKKETVEHVLCFCPTLCRLRLKHLENQFVNDLTEISEINLKNKHFYEIFRVEDMLINIKQVETYKIGDPRKEKTRSCGIAMDPQRSKCVRL